MAAPCIPTGQNTGWTLPAGREAVSGLWMEQQQRRLVVSAGMERRGGVRLALKIIVLIIKKKDPAPLACTHLLLGVDSTVFQRCVQGPLPLDVLQ